MAIQPTPSYLTVTLVNCPDDSGIHNHWARRGTSNTSVCKLVCDVRGFADDGEDSTRCFHSSECVFRSLRGCTWVCVVPLLLIECVLSVFATNLWPQESKATPVVSSAATVISRDSAYDGALLAVLTITIVICAVRRRKSSLVVLSRALTHRPGAGVAIIHGLVLCPLPPWSTRTRALACA